MPVISIKNRTPQNQIAELLHTLYEDVLLLCECDEQPIKNNTKAKKWTRFLNSNKIDVIYNHIGEKGKFQSNQKGLFIASKYAKENICDKIIFTNIKNKVFSCLFSHIRNAFAHNQIFVEGEYVIMYDRLSQNSSVFTMIGHVKIEVLKELIKIIKNIKK